MTLLRALRLHPRYKWSVPIRLVLLIGCTSAIYLVVVRRRDLDRLPVHPTSAPAPRATLAVRACPLRLRENGRRQVSTSVPRLRAALTPVAEHQFLRWNQLIHGLRLWGAEAAGPGKWTGKRMLAVVCSAELSQEVFGAAPHVLNRNGLHFAHLEGRGDKQLDETLSVLGEIGVHSKHRVHLAGHTTSVSAAVRAAAANFVLDQPLEFSAIVLAHYLPPQRAWVNKFGETITFDGICQRFCGQPIGSGACYGCHTMQALSFILAADRQHSILSERVRQQVLLALRRSAVALRETQTSDGLWGARWFERTEALTEGDAIASIAVTGHSLEWLAVAPREVVDDPKMISRACAALVTLIIRASPTSTRENYNAYTHAANAVKMWCPQAWSVATPVR